VATVTHTIRTKDGLEAKRLTYLGAIRAKCLDCCGFQAVEVRLCTAVHCPLWPFRMGRGVETLTLPEPAQAQDDKRAVWDYETFDIDLRP